MRAAVLILGAVLALGACSEKSERVYFAGNYYPAKAKSSKDDRENFVLSVRRVDQGLEGAREAGRHAGVKYCVETFGYSEIDWQVGPDDETARPEGSKGDLVLRGRCRVWE